MKIQFLGYFDQMFQYKIIIGDETFDYRMGIGHYTPRMSKSGNWNKKPANGISFRQFDYDLNKELDGWAHPPIEKEVLECLYADADCGNDSFKDFCDNCGYDSDSISAFKIYMTCGETLTKIRKLERQGLVTRPKEIE